MTTLSTKFSTLIALAVGVTTVGCAAPGTRAHDMSIAGHENAATIAEREDVLKHKAAAQALRDEEARACAGMSEPERELGPFFGRAEVEGVEELYDYVGRGGRVFRGAAISVRPTATLTAEWLQRNIECHIARTAAHGYDAKEMSKCPFGVEGVYVSVRSGGDKFIVDVKSREVAKAHEVWRRARALGSLAQN